MCMSLIMQMSCNIHEGRLVFSLHLEMYKTTSRQIGIGEEQVLKNPVEKGHIFQIRRQRNSEYQTVN